MNTKKLLTLIISFTLFANNAFAEKAAGTTVFNFLKIPVNASQAAFAGISSFSTVSAAVNPSMISFASAPQLSAAYAQHFQETNYNSLSFTYPFEKFGMNIAYGGMNYGNMDMTLEDANGDYIENGTFSADDGFVSVSAGTDITESIHAGVGMKYIWQNIDGSAISGFAINLSGVYLSDEEWYISAGFENVGPDVEGYPMPASAFASFIQPVNDDFICGAEARLFFDETAWLKVAGEYNIKNMFFARAGYSLPVTNNNNSLGEWYERNLSIGFGFEYMFFSVDYAWLPFGELGNTNMFSLQITF